MNKSHSFPTLNVQQFDAAIFDLDGMVTKTARVHAAAWKELFDHYLQQRAAKTGDVFQPFDLVTDYHQYVDGKPRNDGVQSFLKSRGFTLPYGEPTDGPDQETICSLGNRKKALFLEILKEQGVESYDSTIALIRELRSRGKKIAIVTASKNCDEVLSAAGLSHLFEVKVDGHDAAHYRLKAKPAPDVFVKAAQLLDVSPQRAVVFEDALAGVQAGRAGNFGIVIGVDRAGQARELQEQGADLVVSDLVALAICEEAMTVSRNIQVLPSALEYIEEIIHMINGRRLIVFLDYDGTLTPIVERPELAALSEEIRKTLKVLAQHCTVGIISGRDRPDIERLVKLDTLFYAGSHGFDIAGPRGWRVEHEEGTHFLPVIDQAESALRKRLGSVTGVLIERKKYSIAVHYRLVDTQDLDAVSAAVKVVLAEHSELRKTEGKKVYDLQPRMNWNKGKALLWLLDAIQLPRDQVFPLYLGDDLTDEYAFHVLQDIGLGIVVEEVCRFTWARFVLKNPHEVHQFLKSLIQFLRKYTQ